MGFINGMISSLNKDYSSDDIIEKEQIMKYKGITIHKNTTCNTWYARLRKAGKQIYISAKTQKECYNKLKKVYAQPMLEEKKTMTFGQWYEEWLTLFKIGKVKDDTLQEYKTFYKKLNKDFLDKNIQDIDSITITKLLENIQMPRAKQKLYEFLKTLFEKAKDYRYIEYSPMDVIEKPYYKRDRGDILTGEQYVQFVDECTKRKEYALLVILYQGLRIGECLGICTEDINFENLTIEINKSFNNFNKFDTTKNTQSNRKIPIFANTLELLKSVNLIPNSRVFQDTQKTLNAKFSEIKKVCGIKSTFRIHDLRHTFITKCKDNNIPEHIIQHWVGHTIGSKVTSTVYTHIDQTTNIKYIAQMNKNSTQILLKE